MLFSNIIDYKLINNECEGHGYGFVGLDYWGEFNKLISVLLQAILNMSCEILPDCGRPYTPFRILVQTFTLCAFSVGLYLSIIYWGMMSKGSCMYL